MPEPTPTPSGWFPDPLGRYDHRWFNGTTWTSDVSTDGQRFVDPLGTGPGYVPTSSSNGAATASVVMGSIAIAIAWVPFIVVVGGVLAILALVFGTIGLRRSRASGIGRGSSIAGIVMGVLGVAAAVVGVILSVIVVREVIRFAEPGDHQVAVTSCELAGRRARVEGTIVNLDDEAREYTVFVEVDGRTEVAEVDEVDPGETAEWTAVVTTSTPVTDCEPDLVVQGPFPYGVRVDPIDP